MVGFYQIGFFAFLFLSLIEYVLIMLNRKTVANKMKMLLGKGVGFGKIRILRNNGLIDEHVKRFSIEGFDIKDCKYRFDQKRVYADHESSKIIYYREGDVEPIDLEMKEVPRIDGKLYATDINKAIAAGALSVTSPEGLQIKDLIPIIALGATLAVLYLTLSVKGDVAAIVKAVVG